jgi:tRNA G18 (ribose-2'-O)-methylase SpoU
LQKSKKSGIIYLFSHKKMRKLLNSELGRKTITEYKDSDKSPFIIVLDNVRSHNNVGSIFRTADAFLAEAMYLCGITAQPPHRDIQKTALGATESVTWRYFSSTSDAVKELKSNGVVLIAVEQVEGSISLQNLIIEPCKKYAFVFGHEIHGVSQEVVDLCDFCIEIPQFGSKHSFNIAISAGIVLWEACIKKATYRK